MEIYRDLVLNIGPERMAAMVDRIEREPPAGWARERWVERRGRGAPPLPHRPSYGFLCKADEGRPGALVLLTQSDAGTFIVSNIIPSEQHQLKPREYNAVLRDFADRVIRPFIESEGVVASMTEGEVGLEHWMPRETAELLRRFSEDANRGTGASLPADRERWNAFVVASYKDRSRMNSDELRRWLIEVDEWPPEVADQLAQEYDYGRELLAFADGHRWSA